MPVASIPDVLEATVIRGPLADPAAPPRLLVDIPHGATRTADFTRLAAGLESPLPEDLIAFFHVNTDAGAPELAVSLAHALVALDPTASVGILRCLVPRTFIDCNRVIPRDAAAGVTPGMTPGLMPWITAPADRTLLLARYAAYKEAVEQAAATLPDDGFMLLLHTYAPRTVGVEVDHAIVENLRRAYTPEVFPTWPLRPPVDLIIRTPAGERVISDALFDALTRELDPLGMAPADSASYHLHPSTLGAVWADRFPGRVLCPEVRRDLLVDAFVPFTELAPVPHRVDPIAAAFARALHREALGAARGPEGRR
jgi:hypothetical protein